MSGLIKYRVHEVAKDFGMTSKEITQILTDYATTPKNHMQVLEDDELNDIFEYLTQHHQAASLEELYKVPAGRRFGIRILFTLQYLHYRIQRSRPKELSY